MEKVLYEKVPIKKTEKYNKDNFLRTVEMREPMWIPCSVFWPPATWYKYRYELRDLMIRHPSIFTESQIHNLNFDNFPFWHKGTERVDEWGCVWHYLYEGLEGQVKIHPLEDWNTFKSYKPPDPLKMIGPPPDSRPPLESWDDISGRIKKAKRQEQLTMGYLPHGCMFQRLYYLRGFRNLMLDFVTEPPQLQELVDMVLDYNLKMINKWLEMDVDVMLFGDDIGTQTRLPINPKVFRKYLIPAYAKMFRICREAGAHVYLHSDGHIMEVAEDLINAGVTILNLQDRVNGIDNIAKVCKGRVCIDLDIDRQVLLPFGTYEEIENHVREAITKLGSKKGGLMLKADCYPDVPLANIEALCQILEKYQTYYSNQ